MGDVHQVIDSDPHFKIDKTTRRIVDQSNTDSVLMQGDHNSERYTFEIPRYVDGHDMSLCDLVEIHYVNTSSFDRAENKGVYVVDDLHISPTEPEDTVIFSWLISSAVTVNAGPLSFLIRFACTENGKVLYAWNTNINKEKTIGLAIRNMDHIQEENPDLLAHIYKIISDKIDQNGHAPNKFLGVDESGDVVDKDVDYNEIINTPSIPTRLSELVNDANFMNETEGSQIVDDHDKSSTAHNDIRLLIQGLSDRLNTVANSDDVSLDQLSEIVTYIKNNKELIDGVTTAKVSITDIVHNLNTNISNRPLSAGMGVELKKMIDAIQTPDVSKMIDDHDKSSTSHNDIREELKIKTDSAQKYTPEGAKDNVIMDVLGIDATGNFEPAYMKPGIIATEDASTLASSPVTSGAFYAYREVFFLPNRAIIGNPQGKTIVRLTEAWPVPGRMWVCVYNIDIKKWSEWKEH